MAAPQNQLRPPSVLARYILDNENPTVEQLLDLHRAIERECSHRSSHAGRPDPNLAYGTIIQLIKYLSSPLLACNGPISDIFRETQLRALIAALALLLHTEITKIAQPRYVELRGNLASRFSDIKKVATSDLHSQIRKANALFLIRLAAQYFSLIKRLERVQDVLLPSILGLVLASGQYTELKQVFRIADDIIGIIPGRDSQYLNLPALQEITRRATTLLREAEIAVEDSSKRKAVEAAANDVKLVQELLKTYIQEIPSRKQDTWNWPLARVGLGPPSLNKWYQFYGLLDCAGQLFSCLRPEQISIELLKKFAQILEQSEFKEFRWKIIEIFMVCFPARSGLDPLRESLQKSLGLDAPLDISELEVEAITRILKEGVIDSAGAAYPEPDRMTETAPSDGTEQHGLKLVPAATLGDSKDSPRELTSCSTMRNLPFSGTTTLDSIEPCPLEESPTYMGDTNKQASFHSLHDAQLISSSAMKEACSVQYSTDELAVWVQDGEPQVYRMIPSPGPFQRGFAHAGLSSDCGMVFFYNRAKVRVHPVTARSKDVPAKGWPLEWPFGRGNFVVDVSLSKTVVAISTQKALELHLIGSSSVNSERSRRVSHGEWDPSGLATYEHESELLVAIGYQREGENSREGRVFLYRSKVCRDGVEKEKTAQTYDLPRNDVPKCLQFDDQGKYLTCVTAIGNSVLVWDLDEPKMSNPFEITKHRYRPVRDSHAEPKISQLRADTYDRRRTVMA
ncbi:MAG: hypothetical protein Q9196_000373 [Gyalolechia fulgens]